MIEIATLGLVVLFVTIFVGTKVEAPIISSFYLFVAFSFLYCTYMYVGSTIETGGLSLLNNHELIWYVILSTYLGLIFFGIFYLLGANRRSKHYKFITHKEVRINIFIPTYLSLLVILLIFAKDWGWHAVSRDKVEGAGASLFAYGKYFFICMGLVALWHKTFSKKWTIFIFLTQLTLMFLDGGRATFFGLVVAYIWILSRKGFNLKASHVGYLVTFGILLLASRAIVLGEGLIDGMMSSLVAEGIFAGYTGLQMAEYIHNGGDVLFGLTYLIDPIIYLLPMGIRENYLLFISLSVNKYSGVEAFGPMGGFFWMAEAIANFGFLGGSIVGSVYGYLLAKLESNNKGEGYYTIFTISAFTSLLSKYYLANGLKIAIFYLGAGFIIKIFFLKKFPFRKSTSTTSNSVS